MARFAERGLDTMMITENKKMGCTVCKSPLAVVALIISLVSLPAIANTDAFLAEETAGAHFGGARQAGEFYVDTSVVYMRDLNEHNATSLAFDGTNYFVVWMDKRHGDWDIYGARVSKTGKVLDPTGLPLLVSRYHQLFPSVAFDGTNYLVVWHDTRYDSVKIYGTFVDKAGTVLNPMGFRVSRNPAVADSPAVAFDGTNYLVVWSDNRNGTWDIYGTRVSPSGIILDTVNIPMCVYATSQLLPRVCFDGSNYLVVWEDRRNGYRIYGARITTSGTVLDTASIFIAAAFNGCFAPSVAFDGNNFLVAWHSETNGLMGVNGTRVTRAGVVMDPTGFRISNRVAQQRQPSAAFDGVNYLITWGDWRSGGYDIYGARVSPGAVVYDTAGFRILRPGLDPAVVFADNEYFVVEPLVHGSRVTTGGVVLDTPSIKISTIANVQTAPAVASNGTDYLVVWHDFRVDWYADLYGARISQSGRVLDPAGIPISRRYRNQRCPAITSGATTYMVTWEDEGGIYGARVNAGGTVLDTGGIMISWGDLRSRTSPTLALGDTNFFVVWVTMVPDYAQIFGARVSQTGKVIDSLPINLTAYADSQYSPAIAFDGTNFLVIWQDGRPPDIYGTRVAQNGVVLDCNPPLTIVQAPRSQINAGLAFDGTNYFAVWQDIRSGLYNDIYGARITQDGQSLDPLGRAIATGSYDKRSPVVVFDGTDYVVTWQDCRNGAWDIYGARVSTSGSVISSFPVATQDSNQTMPAVTRGAGYQLLFAYSGYADSVNHKPAFAMRTWGKFMPPVGIGEGVAHMPAVRTSLQVNPNPFKQAATIRLQVPKPSQKTFLKIFDVSGRIVKHFELPSLVPRPSQVVTWNGDDNSGRPLPAGVYFCRLESAQNTVTAKIVKLR